ncbi:MAG TPA: BlaI/MecI/CopY family transcriptional regulator, partial [Phenylobacterium sp.]
MTRISAAESQVMEALWAEGPLGADEIVAALTRTQAWGEATVKTLINRLLKKKALVSERVDGRTRYRPLVSREEYVT